MVAVSSVLFAVLAVLAGMVTDLLDRGFPRSLDAQASLMLTFERSALDDAQAFVLLRQLDARDDLGLLKVAPNLVSPDSGDDYIALNARDPREPREVTWFTDQPSGQVREPTRLANSFAAGTYLVTGDVDRLDRTVADLQDRGVSVSRADAGPVTSLNFLARQGSFLVVILAAVGLSISLGLYWLSVKSRGRGLRVLGGAPTWRIQVQDLSGFGSCLMVSAGAVLAAAGFYVGLVHGGLYVRDYVRTLVMLELATVVGAVLAASLISVAAWPSPTMLALRAPPASALRVPTRVLQVASFLLVVATAAPAWSSYQEARSATDQLDRWRSLSEHVVLTFPGRFSENAFQQAMPVVGGVVQKAEAKGDLAFSYAFTSESMPEVRFPGGAPLALVDEQWLRLMMGADFEQDLMPARRADIAPGAYDSVAPTIALWARARGLSPDRFIDTFRLARPTRGAVVPVAAGGSGDLLFEKDLVIAVVPSVHGTFNDDFLTSAASTQNVLFDGVGPTQALLRQGDAESPVGVRFVAEEGILRAQFSSYVSWLRGLSVIALLVAFVLAAAIGALITSLVQARRDFPLRLAGATWGQVTRSRVVVDLAAGVLLTGVVLGVTRPSDWQATVVVAAIGLLAVPACHLLAAQWTFGRVVHRQV